MRFILHYTFASKPDPVCYNLGKIMLYALGRKIHLSGIHEVNYFLPDIHENQEINFKLGIMIRMSQGEEKEALEEILQKFKKINSIKNKSSKVIIDINILKKTINGHFLKHIEQHYSSLESLFGINSFKDLIDNEHVQFYHTQAAESIYKNATVTPLLDILTLQLEEEGDDYPVLFLSNDGLEGEPITALNTYSYQSKEAQQLSNGYLEDAFQFPGVKGMPASIIKSISKEFTKSAQDAIDELKQWVKICYDHPNSTKGLDYFRQNVSPILKQKNKTSFETNTYKEILKSSISNYNFHLQFGELPIEKIWEIIYGNGNCSEEVWQELLKIKETQSPKYDGRWPVVFFKTDDKEVYIKEPKEVEDLKPRKTLNID